MTIENTQQTQHIQQPVKERRYICPFAYARINKISRHMLQVGVKFLAILCFLISLVLLALYFVLLPHIADYKPEIEQMLSSALGRSVSVSQVSGSWENLRPRLDLQQVTIRDERGAKGLTLPNVQATVSWLSLVFAELHLYKLEIDRPELELKRSVDGKIYIDGSWIDPTKKSDVSALNWIFSQRSIVIKNGTLHWVDEQRAAPVLTLSNVNFFMRNRWQRHRFSLTANPPTKLSGPFEGVAKLDVMADFKHHPFTDNIADFAQWKGSLYANITNADLAAWKSYLAYPFAVDQGVGTVRIWFDYDQAKLVNATADLSLTNVKAQLRADLQPLDLIRISGRISAGTFSPETDWATSLAAASTTASVSSTQAADATVLDHFLHNGHQLALTNFSFETRSGMRLPLTTLSERYIPATSTSQEQIQFSTQYLDLTMLAKLAEHFPLPDEYHDLLKNGQPIGQLHQFSVKLQGQFPAFSHFRIKGGFTNLAMQVRALPTSQLKEAIFSFVPSFANLTGHIDMNEKRGAIQVASKNLLLQLPDSFPQSEVKIDLIDMKANWSFRTDNRLMFTLAKFDAVQQNLQAQFYGTYLLPAFSKKMSDAAKGILDVTGTVSHIDFKKIDHYLPSGMDPDLYHWLTQGLQEGRLDNVSVRVKGNLTEFPFVKKGLLDQNLFHVTGKIVDGKINYLPGVVSRDGTNPYWPVLSKINGHIIFDRESMDIHAESGETDGIPVAKVHARIPDLYSYDVMLNIDGTAKSTAQEMLHYLSVSPVLDWTNNFTLDTKVTGNASLKLKLAIPLFRPLDTAVAGDVQLNGNDVALIKEMPLLTQVSGRFSFNENGLNLNTLKGNFLGGPVIVVGGTQSDGVIRITAEGQITADGIRKAYAQAGLINGLARIDGKTPYTVTIQVKNKQTDVQVNSTMRGMALHLPAPLSKTASDQLPLRVERITQLPNISNETSERDEIIFSLGSVVKAHYFRKRESATSAWQVIRGGIGVNALAPLPESGLSMYVDLASFDADEFSTLLWDKPTNLANEVDVQPSNKNASYGAPRINLSLFLEPNLFSLHATDLTLMGKKLNQVVFGATRWNGIWQANINSKQIAGYLTWDNAEKGLGHVTARLDSLIIPETAANDVVDLLQNKNVHSRIPGLDLVADNVELFGKKLGRLELRAKNVNTPNSAIASEWQIDTLRLSNPDGELTAQGKWLNDRTSEQNHAAQSQTNLNYQLVLTNAGKLLDRLGYANLISGGKGKLTGDIKWNGSPYSMDMPSLSGQIQLDLHAGQFLKVDPGAAKLLAVLNLQSLPRHLVLDFRDVFSEGFAFDGITGDADVEKGIAKTDNFKMHSTSATVLLGGTADITHETQDLHVVIVPEVNAAAASIVYGLAVNPVIGVGTFLAQLFLRKPLMKAFTFEYQITGPWKEPNVVKLGQKVENKVENKGQKTGLK